MPATERAISIAERLDDVELLSFGLHTLFAIALVAADYASADTVGRGNDWRSRTGSPIPTTWP